MITYYTIGGLVAVVTLAINIMIILGVMASFGATMTLPGLAGIVLTVGMAVDANILIFERMREELKLGKPLRTALSAGYDKAFITIIDAHVTQLCVCAIMIYFGTGSIRGFGLTLAIGVFSTMFSVLVTGHIAMASSRFPITTADAILPQKSPINLECARLFSTFTPLSLAIPSLNIFFGYLKQPTPTCERTTRVRPPTILCTIRCGE